MPPEIKERIILLSILEATELQLAEVRSLLHDYFTIEIADYFVISATKSFKDQLSNSLTQSGIKHILIYVNLKDGNDLFASGITAADEQNLKKIVLK